MSYGTTDGNFTDFVDHRCSPLNYSRKAPLHLALPLYGYILPIFIILTIVTNSFIVVVLSKPHLRTPSNLILLVMAIGEALTGTVSLPFMTYFYTGSGYKEEATFGLPRFWCQQGAILIEHIPTILHTATIWQTVYLAVQRYIYVCRASLAKKVCTMKITSTCLAIISILSILFYLPKVCATYNTSVRPVGSTRQICCAYYSDWALNFGLDILYSVHFWLVAIFVHAIPCVIMLLFTTLLAHRIRQAEVKRKRTLRKISRSTQRKFSNFMHSYQSSTKMLIAVIIIFLCIEVPAAVIYIMHVLLATTDLFSSGAKMYAGMNLALTLRNATILISYPLNFAIYCCMSKQFRLTVSQLFTKERLFIEQRFPPTGRGFNRQTRYSVMLVSTRQHIMSDCGQQCTNTVCL